MNTLINDIQSANSLSVLQQSGLLPTPYEESGYYFVYYSKKDYKYALKDIVQMSDKGIPVWYDRKLNYGKSWEDDMLAKARNFRCACVVIYLSENAMKSPFFWKLCSLIDEYHVAYCTVNLPDGLGQVCSGEQLATRLNLDGEQIALCAKLFGNDITYISGNLTFEEKLKAIDGVRKNDRLIFRMEENYATVASVKDLAEEKIVVPERVTIGEKDYEVKKIAPRAFANCKRLKEIYIPDSIEYVGDMTAAGSAKLKLDLTGSGAMLQEGRVFEGCASLEEIRMPAHLKTLHTNLFVGCTSLKRIYYGEEVTRVVGENYFEFDCELEELKLPPIFVRRHDGVILYRDEDAGWRLFDIDRDVHVFGCTDLDVEEHYVAKTGEKIGAKFFCDDALRSIDMSLADGQYFSFNSCTNLKSIKLPNELDGIYIDGAFANCQSLEEITLPESVKYIQSAAFANCPLTTIVSDSTSNKTLFKSVTMIQSKMAEVNTLGKKIACVVLSPFVMLFAFIKLLFDFTSWVMPIVGLLGIVTFPISFWFVLFRRVSSPFYLETDARTIYLKQGKRRLKLLGFALTQSDRQGYDKYVKK